MPARRAPEPLPFAAAEAALRKLENPYRADIETGSNSPVVIRIATRDPNVVIICVQQTEGSAP